MIPVQGGNGACLCSGFTSAGWYAQEVDMSLAQANMPYPTSPSTCQGYSPAVAAPAADIWYLYPYWFGIYTRQCITCTDTCHVSFWAGTCGSLQPGNCFTVLPNTPTEIYPEVCCDTLFMQISGTQLTSTMMFDLCTHYVPGTYSLNFLVWNQSTPTTCLASSWNVVDATSISSTDGSVTVNIIAGNGPWTIQWADGDTSFSRTDLLAGEYVYTITDSIGCMQTDTVVIGIDPFQTIEGSDEHTATSALQLSIQQDHLDLIAADMPRATVNIHDATGAVVFSTGLAQGRVSIPLDEIRPGAYTIVCFTAKHDLRSVRFVIHR